MKYFYTAFAFFLVSMIFAPLSMALQRNVHLGANPIDGSFAIALYDGSRILPLNYYQKGDPEKGSYKNLIFTKANTNTKKTQRAPIQRNVHLGSFSVDGSTIIARYNGANVLPSDYYLGVEKQGYYDDFLFKNSNATMQKYSQMKLVSQSFLEAKEYEEDEMKFLRKDSHHRLSQLPSRSLRLLYAWANKFE
ncbi:hypothetical protein K9M59_02740 [Candidatus Gracilibacteria bacterium]|nr:hypothetical protein [Candidatus Gracilibacteria bacterium]MCF7819248.1 hypothetical protein [Candidatus Gracilibacteria bacterium]